MEHKRICRLLADGKALWGHQNSARNYCQDIENVIWHEVHHRER